MARLDLERFLSRFAWFVVDKVVTSHAVGIPLYASWYVHNVLVFDGDLVP